MLVTCALWDSKTIRSALAVVGLVGCGGEGGEANASYRGMSGEGGTSTTGASTTPEGGAGGGPATASSSTGMSSGTSGGVSTSCVGSTPQPFFVDKLDAISDYQQTDTAYGGFTDGYNFCGPTSVSNSLMWLVDQGWTNIVPPTGDPKHDQHDLIATLASVDYFDTSGALDGTPPSNLLVGLKRFLSDRRYTYGRLEFQGFNPLGTPPEFDTGEDHPRLDFIKLGIEGSASAWLLLALGTYDIGTGTFIIRNGHYVTVVGHGYDGASANPSFLVVHDPWTGGAPNAYIEIVPLTSGTFAVEHPDIPPMTFPASGYALAVGDAWSFSEPDVAVIGAIVLEMPCR